MRLALTVAAVLCLGSASLAQDLQVGVNDAYDPAFTSYGVAEVGWFFTPATSFTFNEIRTRFQDNLLNPTNGQPITFELRERVFDINSYEQPGALLRSTTFGASVTMAGGTFDDFQILAGQTYFLGFQGVQDLGVNVADDDNRIVVGHMRYASSVGGGYNSEEGSGVTDSPIFQMLGGPSMVPEPTALALLALGGLSGLTIYRRRR